MLTDREEMIVRWLRGPGPDRDNGGPCRHIEHVQGFCACSGLADAIERGDHLAWKPEPTVPASEWMGKSNLGH